MSQLVRASARDLTFAVLTKAYDRLTFDDGTTLENTRLLRNKLDALADLQQARSRCKKGSRKYKALTRQIAKLHRDVANQRKDELHKLSSAMVASSELHGMPRWCSRCVAC